jgi:hypothetical protein
MWAIGSDDPIAKVDGPNTWAVLEHADEKGMPADFAQREEYGAAAGELPAVFCDDLHCPARLYPQERRHRRSGNDLPGTDAEPTVTIPQREPGSPFATEIAIAVIKQIVLGPGCHGSPGFAAGQIGIVIVEIVRNVTDHLHTKPNILAIEIVRHVGHTWGIVRIAIAGQIRGRRLDLVHRGNRGRYHEQRDRRDPKPTAGTPDSKIVRSRELGGRAELIPIGIERA